MSNRKNLSAEDIELFRETIGLVRPVASKRALQRPTPPPLRPKFREADERAVMQDAFSEQFYPEEWETGDELDYFRQGLQHSVRRRLRRGLVPVEAELDLHGMTVPVARRALSAFLHEATAARIRCVRIIHGKGRGSHQRQPVLKQKVNQWLRQMDSVLAFCACRPYDGGGGAVYVLLRGRR